MKVRSICKNSPSVCICPYLFPNMFPQVTLSVEPCQTALWLASLTHQPGCWSTHKLTIIMTNRMNCSIHDPHLSWWVYGLYASHKSCVGSRGCSPTEPEPAGSGGMCVTWRGVQAVSWHRTGLHVPTDSNIRSTEVCCVSCYFGDEVHQIFISITVMAGLRFLLFPPSFFLILSLSLLSTLRWSCGLVLLTGTPVGGANQFPDASLRTCSASTITSRI